MSFQHVPLQLSEQTKASLKSGFKKVVDFLEQGGSLNLRILDELQKGLSDTILSSKQMTAILQNATSSNEFFHVNLTFPDAEILNLPWGIATDPISKRPLNEHPQIFISKNSLPKKPAIKPATPGPLKILVMIASPKNLSTKGRLNFEDEERQIIQAFEPLFKSGAVQIDFTDDGSLDALRRKVKQNDYHILHFSGHGYFDEKKSTGLLLLENPLNLQSRPATALEFAEAILKEKHTIPLVMLSACQTAQAKFEQGIAGVTGTLLQKGIPAVVSMGMSIADKYASRFAAHFYQGIAGKQSLAEAFSAARQEIKNEEAQEIQQRNLKTIPLQWIIPNLYLTDDIQLVDWNKSFTPLQPEEARILFANTTMEKSGVATDIFVGRREDYSRIMPLLAEKKPILLKGQGGIGKTTMAKKLIQRLKAFQPNLIPFIYNEEGKEFSLQAVLQQLKDFCLLHDKGGWIPLLENYKDNLIKQIIFLLTKIAGEFPILLLFDNLESFQHSKTGEFSIDHQGTLQIIAHAI
ncbi:MAG TPA: CHAT domain-containing protein, partial [bacterium]